MTVSKLMQVAAPLIGLSANVLAQLFAFRIRSTLGLLRSEYLGFLVGLLSLLAIDGVSLMWMPLINRFDQAGIFLLTTLTYGALGYSYFHFINLGETARRIRLLRELYDAGGTLTHQQLLDRYSAQEVVNKRINRLLSTGQIICKEQRYFIGSHTVLYIAQIMTTMKKILLGKNSEYDT